VPQRHYSLAEVRLVAAGTQNMAMLRLVGNQGNHVVAGDSMDTDTVVEWLLEGQHHYLLLASTCTNTVVEAGPGRIVGTVEER
jgi:hypothetical protein